MGRRSEQRKRGAIVMIPSSTFTSTSRQGSQLPSRTSISPTIDQSQVQNPSNLHRGWTSRGVNGRLRLLVHAIPGGVAGRRVTRRSRSWHAYIHDLLRGAMTVGLPVAPSRRAIEMGTLPAGTAQRSSARIRAPMDVQRHGNNPGNDTDVWLERTFFAPTALALGPPAPGRHPHAAAR